MPAGARRATGFTLVALIMAACGPSTLDRTASLQAGASRNEVVAALGAPRPEAEWPYLAKEVPRGCASQLLYRDEYIRGYARWFASFNSCCETWLHVCFDANEKYVPDIAPLTMIQY